MHGYDVAVDREVLEFLDLVGVSADRLTVVGSGRAAITTAPRYEPGRTYALTGATEPEATADEDGRLRVEVDLGPSHTAEQYSVTARLTQDLPGYFTTKTVTIQPLAAEERPVRAAPASPAAPGIASRVPGLGPGDDA